MTQGCEQSSLPVTYTPDGLVATLLYAGEQYLQQHGVSAARREAERLLQTVLSCTSLDLYIHRRRIVSTPERNRFFTLLERRGRREPLQYILGEVDFCGLPFCIQPGVFIPRPETELIVQIAASLPISPKSILDLCTGSGALAIALARHFSYAHVVAVDFSEKALDVAQRNQKRHKQQILLVRGDLLSALHPDRRFDLIVSNPPYLAETDTAQMDPEVYLYEPPLALYSSEKGLAHLKQILRDAPHFLALDGHLLLEIGVGQSSPLLDFIKQETPFQATVHQDWANIPRILHCQWTKS